MNDESALLQRAVRGDREAFDALVRSRWGRLVRLAARIVGDEGEAQDVAQEAVLRVWTTLDRLRPDANLDVWVKRIVTNLAIDVLRRRRARPESRVVAQVEETALPHAGAAPDETLFARELEDALRKVTRDLPPRQKAVFVLARVEGLSTEEIAETLDVTPSTVRNTLFQARAAIARRLRAEFPGLLGVRGTGE